MSERKDRRKLNKTKIADWAMMAVVVSLLGWAAFSTFGPSPLEDLVGKPAPKFKLKTRADDVVGLGDHEGDVVLLDFWATWCDPCFRQMPILAEVEAEVGDEVVVLAINVDDPSVERETAIDSFLNEAGTDRDTLIDTGSVSQLYHVESLPTLVLVGSDGKVHWVGTGVTASERLVAEIEKANGGQGG